MIARTRTRTTPRLELLRRELAPDERARVDAVIASPDSPERTAKLDLWDEAEVVQAAAIRREWCAAGRLEVV